MENVLTFDIEANELEMFLDEVNELLQAMEAGILHLEQAADAETLNATFRAAHSLKAMAGAVGHQQMAELTHTLETFFDRLREDGRSPSPAMSDELLATIDTLRVQRDEVVSRQPSGVDVDANLARLRALMEDGDGRGRVQPALLSARRLTPEQAAQAQACREEGQTVLEVDVVASPTGIVPAARLMQAAMGLAEVGQVIAQHPTLDDLAENRHDGWLWLVLSTGDESSAVEEILGDISELDEFRVQSFDPSTLRQSSGQAWLRPAPSKAEVTGELRTQPYETDTPAKAPAGTPTGTPSGSAMGTDKTVRISVERLDILMNLVGELVTDRTRLMQIDSTLRTRYTKEATVGALGEMTAHFGRVVDQLQDEVMRARMLPISQIFDKFPRLMRDLARVAGKQIDLVIEGESTELDRSIIETIGDPLMHLLRNAADHGLETPEERIAAGKPPTGAVWLSAEHEAGHIVITVEDDGRGIDPDRVRRAAVSRGMISEEDAARLDDDEAVALIFLPNLSTAEQVTAVSGRGVGMDIVRTNVERLNGSVAVDSEVGRGTAFRLTLPLTLAIVQTMLIGLGDDVYAIPLTGIMDSLYLDEVRVNTVKGSPTIRWRDSVLPILNLREFFAHSRLVARSSDGAKPAVVTVGWSKLRLGLVVDRIIGKQEIVVKSFSPIVGKVPGLSGCTILGDGRIALIMDIPSLINATMQARRKETA